jgi:hypothetical protein
MYRENLNFSFVTSHLPFVHNCFFYKLWLCFFNNYRGRLCDVSLLHFIVSHSLCKSVPVIIHVRHHNFYVTGFCPFHAQGTMQYIELLYTRLWSCSCESTQQWMLCVYKKNSKLLTELNNLLFIIHSFYCCERFVERSCSNLHDGQSLDFACPKLWSNLKCCYCASQNWNIIRWN